MFDSILNTPPPFIRACKKQRQFGLFKPFMYKNNQSIFSGGIERNWWNEMLILKLSYPCCKISFYIAKYL